jgi:hypothetical protein
MSATAGDHCKGQFTTHRLGSERVLCSSSGRKTVCSSCSEVCSVHAARRAVHEHRLRKAEVGDRMLTVRQAPRKGHRVLRADPGNGDGADRLDNTDPCGDRKYLSSRKPYVDLSPCRSCGITRSGWRLFNSARLRGLHSVTHVCRLHLRLRHFLRWLFTRRCDAAHACTWFMDERFFLPR